MSLLRLLKAGRSLVSVGDAEPRYRLTTQRLLPDFGSARNPFCGPQGGSPTPATETQPAAPAATAGATASQPDVPRPLWLRLAERVNTWTAKLAERLTRINPKPGKPAVPHFTKPAVQAELSLERVKVVRNDLSDADLEVVPARMKPAPVVMPVESVRVADGAAGRVRTPLIGAGKM